MSQESRTILGQSVKLPFSRKILPNRFLKSSMTERLCTWDENDRNNCGKPTEAYLEAYRRWSEGKTGTILLGNIPVHRDHVEAAGNAIIDKNSSWDAVAEFRKVVQVIQSNGSLCIGQLTHAGRQAPEQVQKHPVSASDTHNPPAMGMTFSPARAMTEEEILDAIDRWAYGAGVLHQAGADGAQLHAAHGYLLSQFLSPRINKRTDKWGGSFENRTRIVVEIVKAIKERVNDASFTIAIKINSQDFSDGAFSVEDCAKLVNILEDHGVELIELSGGTYESLAFEHKKESTKNREGFFTEFADQIRPHIKHAILAVTGGFRSADPMAKAIKEHTCDLIGLARPLCAEPDLPNLILSGKSKGAKGNEVDSAMQTPAAVLQIHSFAEKREIPDISDKKQAVEITSIISGKQSPPLAPGATYPPM